MPAMDEEDRPKKKIVHEIGQDLALLSIKELEERIAVLKRRSRDCKRTLPANRVRATSPTNSSRNERVALL